MNHEQAEKVLEAVIEQNDANPGMIAVCVLLAKAQQDIAALQAENASLRMRSTHYHALFNERLSAIERTVRQQKQEAGVCR